MQLFDRKKIKKIEEILKIYTDLAIERLPEPQKHSRSAYGITCSEHTDGQNRYVTVVSPRLTEGALTVRLRTQSLLQRVLKRLTHGYARILCVGLGNRSLACDALGVRTVERIIAGTHAHRTVYCLTPGVSGMTGIATYDTVRAVTDRLRPDLVLLVDALCARDARNVCSCFQFSTAGITAGSGVASHNRTMDKISLGVPCLAVGVPTVTRVGTLLAGALEGATDAERARLSAYAKRNAIDTYALVTPKEIDLTAALCSKILADALGQALQSSPF